MTRKIFGFIIIHIFILSFFSLSWAKTYIVASNGSGTDCSEAFPCALSYANADASAGDVIRLKAGNYATNIDPSNSGTSWDNMITYEAYGDGDVNFNKNYSFSNRIGKVTIKNRSYIKVDGGDNRQIRLFNTEEQNGFGIVLINSSYCIIDSLYVGGSGSAGYINRPICFTYDWGDFSHHHIIKNCYVDGGDINTNAEDIINLRGDSHHILIEDSIVKHAHHMTLMGLCYNDSQRPYTFVIRNCTFENKDYHGNFGVTGANTGKGSDARALIENNFFGGSCTTDNPVCIAGTKGDASNIQWNSDNGIIRYNFLKDSGTQNDPEGLDTDPHYAIQLVASETAVVNQCRHNRIYNNTIVDNPGWAFFYKKNTTPSSLEMADNVIVNNIMYGNNPTGTMQIQLKYMSTMDSDDGNDKWLSNLIGDSASENVLLTRSVSYCGRTKYNISEMESCSDFIDGDPYLHQPIVFENNIFGTPLFSNPANNDYTLRSDDTACKDQGSFLTQVAVTDIGTGASLIVEDAQFFQDGLEMTDMGVQADWIAIGSAENTVQISSIDYSTNTIILTNSINRQDGDKVWLYKDSSGRRILYGNAPDIGAYEVVQYEKPDPPKNFAIRNVN